MNRTISILLGLSFLLLLGACSGVSISPVDLRCEYMENPRVVESAQPSLSWVNNPGKGAKGAAQTAYMIQVATSKDALLKGKADLWDTGKVLSSESVRISYAGASLSSGEDCWWRVKVWDEDGTESEWSSPAYWGMGILSDEEWKAEWIGAPWKGEETYKKVELERPLTPPAGMSMEDFLKIVQMYMDHPSSRANIASMAGAGNAEADQRPAAQRPRRSEAQQSQAPAQGDPAWDAATVRVPKVQQTPAPLLRKSFEVKGDVLSAKAFVVGLGYFEFYVNGNKLGNEVLMPNQTNYSERPIVGQYGETNDYIFRDYRVLYTAYDITSLLSKGANVAGAIIGEGFYNATGTYQIPFGSSRFLCQIEIKYKDGSSQMVCSDTSWKAKESAILENGVFEGELYDSNREIPGWASSSCDDSSWENAVLRKAPTGKLTAQTSPGDVVYDIIAPVSVEKLKDGSYDVDFGVEITGWVRFRGVKGQKDSTMTVTYTNDQLTSYNRYVFNGETVKDYAPRFTWFTFSKVNVKGVENLQPSMMQAEWVCTNLPAVSEFSASESLLGQVNTIWRRSQLDNTHGGVPSDCPHRERSGYTGDGLLSASAVMENFDAAAFYRKWVRDINDCQNTKTGHVPNVAPTNNGAGGIGWGAAICVVPWEYYLHYGDTSILEDNYFAMTEYVRYMLSLMGEDGVIDSTKDPDAAANVGIMGSLGDWCPPYENPDRVIVHQFYFWKCADICSKVAELMGNGVDAEKYAALRDALYDDFHKRFYDPSTSSYGPFGANVFALEMGVPEEWKEGVVESLRKEMVDEYDGHIFTGIFGTRYLFSILAENGLNDVAYQSLLKKDFPSFGYWIEQGATTTWENWNGSGSHNHPMFGGGLIWLYNSLAGVNFDESDPGYKHIVFEPIPLNSDYNASYKLNSLYGEISSSVSRKDDVFTVEVKVPVGSTATLRMPYSGEEYSLVQGTYKYTIKAK
ncbi:MAG: alpha-L-rhamnosidase N-terminal domain-containing protein [Bacteroidales bacterium]|nr:alpha-L-rhamnosidase N-terminal domain-containing protein [Bacteroidales bacterium]